MDSSHQIPLDSRLAVSSQLTNTLYTHGRNLVAADAVSDGNLLSLGLCCLIFLVSFLHTLSVSEEIALCSVQSSLTCTDRSRHGISTDIVLKLS